ncbi:hypothetical protein HPY42_01980 [Coprothermobacteraceae bacterium]|nr:hypothetical protein [Coprothermobacteraceae bacterium]
MRSFVQIEKELLPDFRERLAMTETVTEVEELFFQTAEKLIKSILPDFPLDLRPHIKFDAKSPRKYAVSETLKSNPLMDDLWTDSDLPAILERFATSCEHRREHLEGTEQTRTTKRPPGTSTP